MKPLLSLVVPVYFEEDCVDTFIDQVQHVLDPMNLRYEFVLIDDGSTDRTCEIIRNRAHSDDPSVRRGNCERRRRGVRSSA